LPLERVRLLGGLLARASAAFVFAVRVTAVRTSYSSSLGGMAPRRTHQQICNAIFVGVEATTDVKAELRTWFALKEPQ
jgi:hypothetical protein